MGAKALSVRHTVQARCLLMDKRETSPTKRPGKAFQDISIEFSPGGISATGHNVISSKRQK